MSKLHISDSLSLPLDAVTQKFAFLGRTGSGKTYAASKLAEEMLGAGAQIVAIDAVGVWFGLRIAADGKSPGLQIPVFGGLHGDIPIEPTGGALIADLIVDRSISVVVDISQFETDAQKARFATDFAARFYFRKKAAPSPIHLFLEECQELIPQNPQGRDEPIMLHHWTRLVKLGRNFGIGESMISQRPQEVSKKCLNLTECMFAFQMTGPHERKTIKSWVEEKGGDLDIVDALPRFDVGEAHCWSPQWLKISKTVKVAQKWTFNSSSTPTFGKTKQTEPKPLDSADMERIREAMAATIERAEQEDPRKLRKRIAELEAAMVKKVTGRLTQVDDSKEIKAEKLQVQFDRGVQAERKRIRTEFGPPLRNLRRELEALTPISVLVVSPEKKLEWSYPDLVPNVTKLVVALDKAAPAPVENIRMEEVIKPVPEEWKHPKKPVTRTAETNGDLTGPQRRILDGIAWANTLGVDPVCNAMAAFAARYSPTSSAYTNPRSALVTAGLIHYPQSDFVALTDAGRGVAAYPEQPGSQAELHQRVLTKLPGPQCRILTPLLKAYPKALTNEECAAAANYSETSSSYTNPRSALRSMGLIEYPGAGSVKAAEFLFPEEV